MSDNPRGAAAGMSPVALTVRGLVMLAVAMGIGRFAFTPLLPLMQQDGLTLSQGAWLAAANYLGYLVGALVAMVVTMPVVGALRAGMLLTAVFTVSMGLTRDFAAGLLLRFAAGVASAVVLVYVSAWCIERLKRAGRPRWVGIVFAGVGVGIATAGLLVLLMMARGMGASGGWIVLGVLAAVGGAVAWPPREGTAMASAGPSPRLAWTAPMKVMVVSYAAFGFGYIVPATFLPAMAREASPHMTLFGWIWPVFGFAGALSTVLLVRRPPSWSTRNVWIGANLVMAAGLVLCAAWPTLPGMAIAGLCIGGTFMVITMVALQEAREAAGGAARTLIAAMTAAFAAGQVVGPLVADWLLRLVGDPAVALLLAAYLLAIASFALAVIPIDLPSPRSAREHDR